MFKKNLNILLNKNIKRSIEEVFERNRSGQKKFVFFIKFFKKFYTSTQPLNKIFQ